MSAAAATAGVTVVMPAYREEANLAGTVEDMLTTLDGIGEEHVVVVVNDGSRDRTGEIADDLAARYPGRVHVVHHEVNRGYGAAVRTGIATALAHTRHAWLFLTDSDGQFRGEQLPHFLAAARAERADAVIGFRPRRADPAPRKVNAWLWTQASRLLLGVGTRDVDCAYKLISRQVLDGVPLRGNAALISPEIMMRIRAQGRAHRTAAGKPLPAAARRADRRQPVGHPRVAARAAGPVAGAGNGAPGPAPAHPAQQHPALRNRPRQS